MPTGPVPEAANEHGGEQVDELAKRPIPVSAHWDIDIFPYPRTKRHMPAPPKVRNVSGNIRKVKVRWQFQADHAAQADGDVAVAAKVEQTADRKQGH